MTQKFNDEDSKQASDEQQEESLPVLGAISSPEMRLIHLYGEVDEKKSGAIVYSLIAYSRIKKYTPIPGVTMDPSNPLEAFTSEVEPIEVLISTPGGSESDMFSIYDTMRMVKDEMEIHTIGMGRVMSAGVLLLAAGTKGKRKIGKNCRVMIHSAVGGMMGSSHDIRNEMKELMISERRYIKALSKETNMTALQIREFLNEKRNIYLSAEEAVKYGIADIII